MTVLSMFADVLFCINSRVYAIISDREISGEIRMIYLVFPTETEMRPLYEALISGREVLFGRKRGLSGLIADRPVKAVAAGIGQANTAHALTSMLEYGPGGLVILAGCAGAYPGSGLKVGDVAVATQESYVQLGAQTPDGFMGLEEMGLPTLVAGGDPYFGAYPFSDEFHSELKVAAERSRFVSSKASKARPKLHFGPFLTVSTVTGTTAAGKELFGRYGAVCENMEGAAAAQLCTMYGVPCIEVRGISNIVEDRDRSKWEVAVASRNCVELIKNFIGQWNG